jgi:hypothetical protein
MSRIRSIKPEFFSDEKVARLSRDSRLFFVGIWTVCSDDYGVSRAHPGYLRQIFPYDSDIGPKQIAGMLDELETEGFIGRFEAEGERYLHIWGWTRHQRVDHPAKFRNPEVPETLARTSRHSRASVAHDQDHRPSTIDHDHRPSTTGVPSEPATSGPEEVLFGFWKTELRQPGQVRLTAKLRKQITIALRDYPLDTLKLAVTGMGRDPWSERPLHLGLKYVLRDVDKFVALANGVPVISPKGYAQVSTESSDFDSYNTVAVSK